MISNSVFFLLAKHYQWSSYKKAYQIKAPLRAAALTLRLVSVPVIWWGFTTVVRSCWSQPEWLRSQAVHRIPVKCGNVFCLVSETEYLHQLLDCPKKNCLPLLVSCQIWANLKMCSSSTRDCSKRSHSEIILTDMRTANHLWQNRTSRIERDLYRSTLAMENILRMRVE